MPKASKDTAPHVQDAGVMVGRYAELDGYTVGFARTPTLRRCSSASPTIAASARTGATSSRVGSHSATAIAQRPTKRATRTTPRPATSRKSLPGRSSSSSAPPPSCRRRWRSSSATWRRPESDALHGRAGLPAPPSRPLERGITGGNVLTDAMPVEGENPVLGNAEALERYVARGRDGLPALSEDY